MKNATVKSHTSTFYVEGMTCVQCEKKIETQLKSLSGVSSVKATASRNKVIVCHDDSLVGADAIITLITSLDYTVRAKVANNRLKAVSTISSLILFGVLFLFLEKRVSFDFIPQIRQNMGYGTLLVVGLLTSFHCVAMCGGINISQCSRYTLNKTGSITPSLQYNLGRVVSYTIIGGIVGGIGSVLSLSGQLRGYVTITVGVIMMFMALKMLKLFHVRLPLLQRLTFLRKLKLKLLGKGPFFVGLANGLMPCGPLQSMQLYALGTGSVVVGALSMFYFSLGTFPLMFSLGFMSTFLNNKFAKNIMRYSAFLVFILGVSMFSRGASLSGILLPFNSNNDVIESQVDTDDQVVRFDLAPNNYPIIRVVKGIPVTLLIDVDDENLNGCNNPVSIPDYDITMALQPGLNEITFTPLEEGKVAYTCWMGMITSYIEVIEE